MSAVSRYFRAQLIVGFLTVMISALAGYAALILVSDTEINVGPLKVAASLAPAWHGTSIVELPPAGSFEASTHAAPIELRFTLKEIAVSQVEELTDPGSPARQALDNW